MAVVRKYQFDREFDAAPVAAAPPAPAVAVEPELAPEPEPEPTYSAAELDQARQQGLNAGRIEGIAEAEAAIGRLLASATEQLARSAAALAADGALLRERLERQAAGLVLDLMRTLAPALLARTGTGEIEKLLDEVFAQAIEQPKLVVRCAPDLVQPIEQLVGTAASGAGFDGRLAVMADARLSGDDCRIEWAEGGVERSGRKMIERVEAAVLNGMAEFDRRTGGIAPSAEPAEEAAA
jgi:flagellar assembly protein FliH